VPSLTKARSVEKQFLVFGRFSEFKGPANAIRLSIASAALRRFDIDDTRKYRLPYIGGLAFIARCPMKKRSPNIRRGILAGGNWIIDQVKLIDTYPEPEKLGNIQGQSEGTGGAPFNVLVDLAKAGAGFPLAATGMVGRDDYGRRILAICKNLGIDTTRLQPTSQVPTSYTDVMTERGSGRRTFFHARGANALWQGTDLEFNNVPHRIFHLGYLLLLDALDKPDAQFGTKAARLLAAAQAAGLKTSVDVVSENSDRFARIVTPALKHVDFCILNDFEAGKTTGEPIRKRNGNLNLPALQRAGAQLLAKGVKELVVVHFPEGAYARSRNGAEVWQPSVKLPANYIAGTAGAGDAFCAGVLLGLHEGWDLKRCLETGVCLAAASLSHPTCTDGVKSLNAAMQLGRKYGFRPVPLGTA
jgi:sugar/nucleoside kinase (ribokinase family)